MIHELILIHFCYTIKTKLCCPRPSLSSRYRLPIRSSVSGYLPGRQIAICTTYSTSLLTNQSIRISFMPFGIRTIQFYEAIFNSQASSSILPDWPPVSQRPCPTTRHYSAHSYTNGNTAGAPQVSSTHTNNTLINTRTKFTLTMHKNCPTPGPVRDSFGAGLVIL